MHTPAEKKRTRPVCIAVILFMILTCIPADSVFAVKKEVAEPSAVTSFQSSEAMDRDYCKAKVKGKTMTVEFRTMIPSSEFRIALFGVVPKTKYTDLNLYLPAENLGQTSTGRTIFGFRHTIDFTDREIPDGKYFLYISRIENPGDPYEKAPNSGGLYKNMVIRLTNGTPKIMKYKDVIEENQRVKAIGADYDPSWYLDETLEDIRFTLRVPMTDIYHEMTPSKISFMRNMSAQITAGASNDYDKLLKIYEYVAGEFYYDSIAFSTHSYQYANPYDNLYNHVYKIASENSDSQGRVATTCQGYSAILLSLARAQGIPTRFVYGHRATSPTNSWETEPNIGNKDHWWVESYVDGRWIFIDPTIGTNNKYNKNTKVWQYYGLNNYTYFDPTDEQIAVSHIYHNIYPDKRFGYLITDEGEIEKLTAFLNRKTDGKKNGTIMNSAYTESDKTTWGDGFKSHFMTDGYGKTTQIQWSKKGFTGDIDFSGFKKLRLLSMHHNRLENADLSNCPNLEKVYLYNNSLNSVNLENARKLQKASITTENSLKDAWIFANGRNRYVHAGKNGAFQMKYDRSEDRVLELRFKPNIGYKAAGLYNGNGKKLTSSQQGYKMNPGYLNYEIKFVLDPDSYHYDLYEGRNAVSYRPYTKAAQKRLKALGYDAGDIDGIFDADLTDTVKVFQHVNSQTVTGKIGESTWRLLFSTKAQKKPSDEVINQIISLHQQHLSGEIALQNDRVVLTWTLNHPSAAVPDGYQIWKSVKENSGFRKIGTTENFRFTNRSNLKKGTRYYYKVRGYQIINSRTYYTPWERMQIRIPSSQDSSDPLDTAPEDTSREETARLTVLAQ